MIWSAWISHNIYKLACESHVIVLNQLILSMRQQQHCRRIESIIWIHIQCISQNTPPSHEYILDRVIITNESLKHTLDNNKTDRGQR